jgi:aryl-alcohol dehydrogenase-like predicted oxidoreductase
VAPGRVSCAGGGAGYGVAMQQRAVGSTGLRVSRLGLGTMTWGRDTDEHEARDQLIAFAEAGGTLLDTAAGYGDGASEELIGTLIGDVVARDEIVLATKAGISRRTGERVTDTSRGHLLSSLDASLKRLGVDHVDLWQVHVWTDATPVEETLGALDFAVSSGRASYVGISNYSGWQTGQAATWQRAVPGRTPLASTQVEYSLLNRAVEHEVLPAARALGLGVLPWSPLGRGVLTGKYRGGTPSDSRGASPHFSGFVGTYLDERGRGIVESVARAAEGLGWTPLEVALVWVRDRPGVTAPVVGARTAAQLAGALGVEELVLPSEIVDALDDVSGE